MLTAVTIAFVLPAFLPAPGLAQESIPPFAAPPVDAVGNLTEEDSEAAQPQADAGAALRRTRDLLVGAGDFAAALGPAEQVVATLGVSNPDRPRDLSALARIQAELEDFTSSELNYLDAIEHITAAEGEFSISLLEPYRGLGRSYLMARRFPEAITTLEQAQHVTQRHLGLFNVSQTGLIDDLTAAHLGLGDTATARELQVERLDNAIRRYGENDPRTIPFRYRLGDYYDQSRMREAARQQYQQVVTLIEGLPDGGEGALLEPLRRLVELEMRLRDRQVAHDRLSAILQRGAGIEATERARSLAVLGDWAIVHQDSVAARTYYAAAFELLRNAPDVSAGTFGRPAMLDFVAPLSPVDRNTRSRPYTWGTIVLELDVSADGRASDVTVVSSTPPGVMDEEYVRRIRETHFRPRIVAGIPQPTADVRFTHSFRHYVED